MIMRLTRVLLAAVLVAVTAGGASSADKTLRFAVVPKAMNNPYFDLSRDGCMARAKALGNVECVYTGPVEHEPASQVQIIQDLITQGIDGLAISVSDADAVIGVIKQARDAGIAVITFDADSPKSARQAYVGTDNKDMGAELARQLIKLHPQPGEYITQSGGPAAENLNERLAGLNGVLQGAGGSWRRDRRRSATTIWHWPTSRSPTCMRPTRTPTRSFRSAAGRCLLRKRIAASSMRIAPRMTATS